MLDQTKYRSIFKIDGKHILPPLMTNKRRLEMQQFKKLAQAVENRLKEQKININPNNNELKQQTVLLNTNHDYKLPNTPNLRKLNKCLENDIEYLQLSRIINNDDGNKVSKTLKNPNEPQKKSSNFFKHKSAEDVTRQCEEKIEQSLANRNESNLDNKCKPETPLSTSESIYIERPKLIRSNSYTLDEPSPYLMKFIEQQKYITANKQPNEYNIPKYNLNRKQVISLDSANAEKKTDGESTNNISIKSDENNHNNINCNSNHKQSISKIKSVVKRTKPRTVTNRKPSQHTVPVNNKFKSPYDYKSKIQMKLNKSFDNRPAPNLSDLGNIITTKKQLDTNQIKSPFNQARRASIENEIKSKNIKPSSPDMKDIKLVQESFRKMFTEIENQHKIELESLFARQKKEQKLMQDNFNKQQNFLMQQMRQNYPTMFNQVPVKNIRNESPVKKRKPVPVSPNRASINKKSPTLNTISLSSNKSPDYCDKTLDSSRPSSSAHTLFYSTAEDCNTDSILSFDELPNKHTINTITSKKLITLRSKTSPGLQTITNAYLKEYLGSVKQEQHNLEQKQFKCIKRLFQTNDTFVSPDPTFDHNDNLLIKSSDYHHFSTDSLDLTKHNAAIIIQACIRGYLTRRLFKTEYVQTIIQTIKDTLLFVLDLHYEIKNSNNQVDLKLKAQLLQQLTSACYNLHDVFFKKTLNEKLQLIRKDREYLKNKLKRGGTPIINISRNNNSNLNINKSNNNINKSKNNYLKTLKLEKCSLFPVNIRASSCQHSMENAIKSTQSMNSIPEATSSICNENKNLLQINLQRSVSNENISTNDSKIDILYKFLKSINIQRTN